MDGGWKDDGWEDDGWVDGTIDEWKDGPMDQ